MHNLKPVLELKGIDKVFIQGATQQRVLQQINLQVKQGELLALVGQSGSGKSSLLNLMGLLDTPSAGELIMQGQLTNHLSDNQKTQLRNQYLGFVFQFHHLLSAFNVLDNVLMPLMLSDGKPSAQQRARALELLEQVGLVDLAQRSALALSGGQQQRVAIARALINQPALLLADEPTGNLDSETSAEVFALFKQLNRSLDCAIVIVTHDPNLSQQCPRKVQLHDGKIIYDGVS